MMLSNNFSLAEAQRSMMATRLGIDNSAPPDMVVRLKATAEFILQPVRDHYGIPFSPSSWYRSIALNRAIGSHDGSQHITGEAADFELSGVSNYDLAKWVSENLTFDQLILEFHTPGVASSGWVHCSMRRS